MRGFALAMAALIGFGVGLLGGYAPGAEAHCRHAVHGPLHHHRHHRWRVHRHHRERHRHHRRVTFERFERALATANPVVHNPVGAILSAIFQPQRAAELPRRILRTANAIPRAATGVLAEAQKFVGDGNITGKPGKWCKWFVNLVLRRAGYRWQPSGRARDSRLLGPPTGAHPGAIAYSAHHTAFVAAVRGPLVLLLGGNQQGHRVTYMWWPRASMRYVEPVPI